MLKDEFIQVLDALPTGVFVVDRLGRPYYANEKARQLLGQGLVPSDGSRLIEVYHAYLAGTDQPYPAERAPIVRALSGERSTVSDMEIRRPDRTVAIEVTAAPIYDQSGTIAYAAAVFSDISERKRAEAVMEDHERELALAVAERTAQLFEVNAALARAKEGAERADRAKTLFLASMSHDLRTPLNHILGYAALLEEGLADHGLDGLQPDLKRIKDAGTHLSAIISDILDLATIESGDVTLQVQEFALSGLVAELTDAVRPLGEKNLNALRTELPSDLGLMRSDRGKVRQALLNPLTNACRYTKKGEIVFSVAREHVLDRDWIRFRVTDTGLGMTPEQVAGLFGGFERPDTTPMRMGGTGLGLAIARRFCEVMGGDMSVESAPRQGTTVTLRMPAELAA